MLDVVPRAYHALSARVPVGEVIPCPSLQLAGSVSTTIARCGALPIFAAGDVCMPDGVAVRRADRPGSQPAHGLTDGLPRITAPAFAAPGALVQLLPRDTPFWVHEHAWIAGGNRARRGRPAYEPQPRLGARQRPSRTGYKSQPVGRSPFGPAHGSSTQGTPGMHRDTALGGTSSWRQPSAPVPHRRGEAQQASCASALRSKTKVDP